MHSTALEAEETACVSSISFREGLSLPGTASGQASWPRSLEGPAYLCLSFTSTGYKQTPPHLAYVVGFGLPNSVPYTCKARDFLTEPFPYSLHFKKNYNLGIVVHATNVPQIKLRLYVPQIKLTLPALWEDSWKAQASGLLWPHSLKPKNSQQSCGSLKTKTTKS